MITKLKFLIPLFIFFALVVFLWKGLGEDPHIIPSALIGKPIPQFVYPSLFDQQKPLTNELFLGHVSLLNVWASWCYTCRAEHGVMMHIAASHDVALYGLNYKDKREVAEKWLKQAGDPFQKIIYDPDGKLGINLGVYGTPETFLIDKHGIIRDKLIGPVSPELWENKLLPEIEKLKKQL